MPEYRREKTPGACYFFSVVTFERRPILGAELGWWAKAHPTVPLLTVNLMNDGHEFVAHPMGRLRGSNSARSFRPLIHLRAPAFPWLYIMRDIS
jgi:hypothetical protein